MHHALYKTVLGLYINIESIVSKRMSKEFSTVLFSSFRTIINYYSAMTTTIISSF